jgi:ketosteroid isomerase-like protein
MSDDLHDFEQFMKQRDDAARAYVSGDAGPLGRIVAHSSPATFFAPMGGYIQGADKVSTRYKRDAEAFERGSDSRFEVLHMAASDGIAYWTGFQRASARMRGQAEAVPFNLRITEVFRREGGSWKLIHRHADTLVEEPQKKSG